MLTDQRDEILGQLMVYVRQELLGDQGDAVSGVDLRPDSPLLEWGVLNSLNTARLIAFVRAELDVDVPPTHITGRHFRSLDTITDLILSLPRA
ncbi:phosphopantetheine-binding protein [Micromonospora sp. NPDC005413]|uniref:phosphopantetheine-binding protein n=1 Tax=Micromonospora sp. NPDC005413 TaxID=3154563 RepID=UPI0033A06A13